MSSKKWRRISEMDYYQKYDQNKGNLSIHSSCTDVSGRFSGGTRSHIMTCWAFTESENPWIKEEIDEDLQTGEKWVAHWLYCS